MQIIWTWSDETGSHPELTQHPFSLAPPPHPRSLFSPRPHRRCCCCCCSSLLRVPLLWPPSPTHRHDIETKRNETTVRRPLAPPLLSLRPSSRAEEVACSQVWRAPWRRGSPSGPAHPSHTGMLMVHMFRRVKPHCCRISTFGQTLSHRALNFAACSIVAPGHSSRFAATPVNSLPLWQGLTPSTYGALDRRGFRMISRLLVRKRTCRIPTFVSASRQAQNTSLSRLVRSCFVCLGAIFTRNPLGLRQPLWTKIG